MDTFYAGAILAALFIGLVVSRLSATVLFLMAAIACLLAGLIEPDAFWAKATNEGLVTLMLLMLCAVALERLPWLGLLSRGIDSPNRYLAVEQIWKLQTRQPAHQNQRIKESLLNQLPPMPQMQARLLTALTTKQKTMMKRQMRALIFCLLKPAIYCWTRLA